MAELSRRLELPTVELAPIEMSARAKYLSALRAADQLDWRPLRELWQERLENAV